MTALEIKANPSEANATPWALEKLPPFPAVAMRLLTVLAKPDVDVREIAKIVAAEPVFATRVLQMANSPLFAVQQQVKAIPQAIVLLGVGRVKAITITRGMGDYVAPAINLKTLRTCWENSLAGAILAEKLAFCSGLDADFAYVAGLVRDIGRLALLIKYPQEYTNVVEVSGEEHYDLMATERELFDVDHCQAGAWLIERMPLPPELVEVVSRHHETIEKPFRMVHVVRIADRMADALGFSVLPPLEPVEFETVVNEFEAISGARFGYDAQDLKPEITAKFKTWA